MNEARLRLDKWLWHARFCKTRTQAAALCESDLLRINDMPVRKASQTVKTGDKLRVPRGPEIMTIEILALGSRRGPYREAITLYREPDPGCREPLSSPAWAALLDESAEFC